jgi:hypothetical protein
LFHQVAGDAPHDSVQRALFYFLTGRWEEYGSLDFDHAFLRTVYEGTSGCMDGSRSGRGVTGVSNGSMW